MALEDDIKTGVDAEWIEDSRGALRELIRNAHVPINWEYESAHITALAKRSAEIADAMAAERKARGGIRNPNDIRENMALFQENMPTILKFIEGISRMTARGSGG